MTGYEMLIVILTIGILIVSIIALCFTAKTSINSEVEKIPSLLQLQHKQTVMVAVCIHFPYAALPESRLAGSFRIELNKLHTLV